MLEGIFYETIMTHPYIRPYSPQPQQTSGYYIGSQSIYKYSLKESDYPTIIISDPLFNNEGGIIQPGYYELALSDSREFLILIQSKNPIAVIPVFKVQEDETEKTRLENKKVKKALKKQEKARKDTNKKREKAGMTLDEEQIYKEAKIEYNPKEKYYIIKYQRGSIKAWGAFKAN